MITWGAEEGEFFRKQLMLFFLTLLGIIALLIMAAVLYRERNFLFSGLNFTVSLILCFFLFLILRGKNINVIGIISIALIQCYFIFIFHSGTGDQKAFVWYYMIPLVSLFILGALKGSILSLSMIVVSIVLNFLTDSIPFFMSVPPGTMTRIVISYIGVYFCTLFFEMTRRETHKRLIQMMKDLNELAIRDGLTGLYNRRYMDEVIVKIINNSRRTGSTVGFLMADLDYFKAYNDLYGHPAGDAVLNSFAETLVSQIRRQTDLIFRYGGEEFAILLSPTNRKTIESLAKTIIEKINALNLKHEASPYKHITVSLGVTTAEINDRTSFADLVENADKALYEAKEKGRNCYILQKLET